MKSLKSPSASWVPLIHRRDQQFRLMPLSRQMVDRPRSSNMGPGEAEEEYVSRNDCSELGKTE